MKDYYINTSTVMSNKFLVICRHGHYLPGSDVLSEVGVSQISLVSGLVSSYLPGPISVFHSDGPRSIHSALVACEKYPAVFNYSGLARTRCAEDVVGLSDRNAIYFTSGEQMNDILAPLTGEAGQATFNYRATKGKVYAEVLSFASDGAVDKVHSLELT